MAASDGLPQSWLVLRALIHQTDQVDGAIVPQRFAPGKENDDAERTHLRCDR